MNEKGGLALVDLKFKGVNLNLEEIRWLGAKNAMTSSGWAISGSDENTRHTHIFGESLWDQEHERQEAGKSARMRQSVDLPKGFCARKRERLGKFASMS